MAASMRGCPRFAFLVRKALQYETSPLKQHIRHASAPVARPAPEELDSKHNRTYVEVLEELKEKPTRVNIGYVVPQLSRREMRSQQKTRKYPKEISTNSAKYKTIVKGVQDDILQRNKDSGQWSNQMFGIGEHYNVFQDLFREGYFHPQYKMNIEYTKNKQNWPVHCGSIIPPKQTKKTPSVKFEGKDSSYYTLTLTGPDSHLQHNDKEVLHWMMGNIKGQSDDYKEGELLCNYLQTFPVRGSGFHRYIFILYEHDQPIDLSAEKRPEKCLSLDQRTFSTYDFYSEYQEKITPVSFALFESEWDVSVTKLFHEKLDMKEPSFEFMEPTPYHPTQKEFPFHEYGFNRYLDRYRDTKDINEQVLKTKLKGLSPFKRPKERPIFPNLVLTNHHYQPMWVRKQQEHQRLRRHQWQELDD